LQEVSSTQELRIAVEEELDEPSYTPSFFDFFDDDEVEVVEVSEDEAQIEQPSQYSFLDLFEEADTGEADKDEASFFDFF
jgi:hypothetical protein